MRWTGVGLRPLYAKCPCRTRYSGAILMQTLHLVKRKMKKSFQGSALIQLFEIIHGPLKSSRGGPRGTKKIWRRQIAHFSGKCPFFDRVLASRYPVTRSWRAFQGPSAPGDGFSQSVKKTYNM